MATGYCSNPHMQSYSARLSTFATWQQRVKTTTADFASAGLFYLGQRDRTKCYFCNGGLQNWEYGDDPWVEHAKYYPQCQHVLSVKGQDFINSSAQQAQRNVSHATVAMPQPSCLSNTVELSYNTATSSSTINQSTPNVSDFKPTVKCNGIFQDHRQCMESLIVKAALGLGFNNAVVEKCTKRMIYKYKKLTSAEELTQMCIEEDDNPIPNDDEKVQDRFPLKGEEIENLKTMATCRVCLVNIRACVFQPCKHLCCCYSCSASLKKCPICRKIITSILGI